MAAVPTTDHRLSTPEDGRLPPAVGPRTTDPSRTMDSLVEVQFDGLPGPTHHFGGLSHGNLASTGHAGFRSRPRAAARQGLAKMRAVLALGVVQALLPPLMRPDLDFLRDCGFAGNERAMLLGAEAEAPRLLRWAQSSAAMWTANCATVAPGIDSDGTTRLVVANLVATAHRQLEAAPRAAMLRRILRDVPAVAVIDALPALAALSDEGAANHCRLAAGEYGHPGVHLFVHGRAEGLAADRLPSRFPARQQRDASAAVARLLALPAPRVLHARQDPRAIDAGAFHNDVVMVADRDRALLHDTGAQIAFCPSSNLFLGSGLFDWRAAEAAGVAVSVAGALSAALHGAPPGVATEDLVLARVLAASGDAFITGMIVAIFVAFRPHWLATYTDRLYLPRS